MELNEQIERTGLHLTATLSENRARFEKLHMMLESQKKIIVENLEHFKRVEYDIFPVDVMKDMIATLQAMIQLLAKDKSK